LIKILAKMQNQPSLVNNEPTSLEIPYAFGKLNVYEILDPSTNEPTGVFNITDHERGFSFGVLKISDNQALQDGLDNLQNIIGPEKVNFSAENFANLNLDDQLGQQNSSNMLKRSCSDDPPTKTASNMIRLKQENAYLVEGENPAKKQKTNLQMFKERIENLNLPYGEIQWGSLLFYSGKQLVHTQHLWGLEDSVTVSQESLLNVQVPVRFGACGQFNTESLVEDFRYFLGDGFRLTRSKENVRKFF